MILEAEIPMVYLQQDADLGKPVMEFQAKSEGLRTRGADVVIPDLSLRAKEDYVPSQQSGIESELYFPLYFCSIWALTGGPSASLSLLVQILISVRNTLTDTPRNNV